MMLLQEPPKKEKGDEEEGKDDEEQEEEEEVDPLSHLNLIWDDTKIDDIDDDVFEETCVGNDYNLQSKGVPKYIHSPSTLNTYAKKYPATTTSSKIS